MTCTLEAPGARVEVRGQASPGGPGWASIYLLSLDAKYGLYGEKLAGLLLAPYRLDCDDPALEARVREAAHTYRHRVTVEQAYDLAVRLGPLAAQVPLRPSYVAVSRMSLLKSFHGGRYAEYLSRPGALDELDSIYAPLLSEVAEPAGGGLYRVRPPRAREALKILLHAMRAAGAGVGARARLPPRVLDARPGGGGLLDEPWRLLAPPEGVVVVGCGGPGEAAERALGGGVECRAPSRIASTLLCEGPRGRAAVKEYTRMAVKWLPAAALGRGYVSYRVSPKSRMAAEYRYLRLLRPIARTPRVLEVCADYTTSVMVREYVEGTPTLSSRDPGDWGAAGRLLARIHRAGYAVGDPNPGNFIVDDVGARLIDAEQARPLDDRAAAWDLAVFAAYARFMGAPRDLIRAALEAYREEARGLWGRVSRLAASPRLWVHLSVTPRVALELQQLFRELARGQA